MEEGKEEEKEEEEEETDEEEEESKERMRLKAYDAILSLMPHDLSGTCFEENSPSFDNHSCGSG